MTFRLRGGIRTTRRLRGGEGTPQSIVDEVVHRGTQCASTSLAYKRARSESVAAPHQGITELLNETIQSKIVPLG